MSRPRRVLSALAIATMVTAAITLATVAQAASLKIVAYINEAEKKVVRA